MICPTFAQTNHNLRILFTKYVTPPKYLLSSLQKDLEKSFQNYLYLQSDNKDFSFLKKILPRNLTSFKGLKPEAQKRIVKLCQEHFFSVQLLNKKHQEHAVKITSCKINLMDYRFEDFILECFMQSLPKNFLTWTHRVKVYTPHLRTMMYFALTLKLFSKEKITILIKEKLNYVTIIKKNLSQHLDQKSLIAGFQDNEVSHKFLDVAGLRYFLVESQWSVKIFDQSLISLLSAFRLSDGKKIQALSSWQNLSAIELKKNYKNLKNQIKNTYCYLPNLLKKKIFAKLDHFLLQSYLCTTAKKCNISIRRAKQLSRER